MSYFSVRGEASMPLLNLSGSRLAEPSSITGFLFDNLSLLHARREHHRLALLGTYRDDWDGRGSLAPSSATIAIAKAWISEISKTVSSSKPWMHPHITVSEEGEAVFEWWRNDKKITLYISEYQILAIKVWGDDVERSMEDISLRHASEFSSIWNWLFS